MSTIKPTTTQTISMRQQVLDNAAQALGKETEGPSFSERMGGAVREVADAQNTSAALTRAYEMGEVQDLSKVMVSLHKGLFVRLKDDSTSCRVGALLNLSKRSKIIRPSRGYKL